MVLMKGQQVVNELRHKTHFIPHLGIEIKPLSENNSYNHHYNIK